MNKKKLLAILCAIAMMVTIIPADTAEAAAKKNTLTLSKTSCVMKKGTKFKLKVTGTLNSFNGQLKWSTSNWKVAVVTQKGVVIARRKGKTVITVTAGKQKASCSITVGTPVTKIKPSKTTVTLTAGKTAKIKAGIAPKKASVKTLKFTSKNKKIATVSKTGKIKGIAKGTTQVIIQSTDGSNTKTKVKVKVTAKKKAQTPINVEVNPVINVILPTSSADNSANNVILPTSTADNSVKVTGISLSDTEKALNINENAQLTASVLPANVADSTVTWASSNEEVAAVSDTGLVTPEGEGEAEITATTADGNYSASCKVIVTATAVVSTDKEIAYALSKKNLKRLEVDSTRSKKLTVPEGTYSNVDMVVSLPNGELENNGVFKSITIEEIAEDTYFENAIGNIIEIVSKKAHIVIDEKASASIILSKDSKNTAIENNGTITKLEVNTKGQVDITGLSSEEIPVEITAEVTISSTLKLNITASSHFDIAVRPGAESTEITVDIEANMPDIFGLGIISVKITATGEIKNIIGENKGADELASTVKITGSVRDDEGNAIDGAQIYIVRYSGLDYDVSDIWSDSEAVRLTTDADGEYTTNNKVKAGNYYLAARKEGYMDLTRQIVVITKDYGDTYTNEEIILLPADWEGKKGNVTGNVLDSAQKDLALSDIAVRLRKGKGTVDSNAKIIKETRTNSEGVYRFDDLEAGYYTIEFADDKTQAAGGDAYLTTWINVLIRPDVTVTEGAIMSKALESNQIRFVLRWGSKEIGAVADLDAHLRGPSGYEYDSDYRFHTCYFNKEFDNGLEENGSKADLDVDDMDYKGPETTTIYESVPGVYSYYVHDYTNRWSLDSDKLSNSSVSVEVYIGNQKQNTYYIPKKEGTVWHVFDYDSNTNTFQTVNNMYYETDSGYVGNTVAEYKQQISSDMNEIEEYQKSLEEGTGDDILEKIKVYQQRADALTEAQEVEAAKLRLELYQYYNDDLYLECFPECWAENVSCSMDFTGAKMTISRSDTEVTAANFVGRDGASVTEVTSDRQDAWKAFLVVAENGHARTIYVYLKLGITSAKVGKEELSIIDGYDFYGDQGTLLGEYLYVYSQNGTDFALKDIQFTCTVDEKNVICDSKKVDGEYTITLQSGSETKIYIIRKLPAWQITDPDNKIYKTRLSGNYIYIYADDKTLSENCVFTVNGKQYELEKTKSEPDYTYYHASSIEGSTYFSIYCYAIDDVCTLKNVYFNGGNVEVSIDQKERTVTLIANDASVAAENLSYNYGYTNYYYDDINITYEAVTGEDYIGKITVDVDGVTDYSKVYEVYFEHYQQSED